jgi:hypothetical protein
MAKVARSAGCAVESALPEDAGVERRKMFGYPSAFI